MIPSNNIVFEDGLTIEQLPSLDHNLDLNANRLVGKCENREEVRQAIYLILNTERYRHVIYSWGYGVELEDLFGQPMTYVIPEVERRVTEALLRDDRITGVDSFEHERNRENLHTTFTVHTTFGDIESEVNTNV